MTYRTHRRLVLGLAVTLLGLSLAAAGAQSGNPRLSATTQDATPLDGGHFWDALALEPQPSDVWSRLRGQLAWQEKIDHPRVQEWIDHYSASPHNVEEITERARPWMSWILDRLQDRDLPAEIALLPFVESSFDPTAGSHRGARGLWQFMPRTGDSLGLRRNRHYDGRLDVVASTRAALDYIEQQAERWYEGDLLLSLAAYNAGAGTVNRARRAAGADSDYWALNLPSETMNYVPKLLAIAAIINEPERYGVALPEIEDAPAFAKVTVDRPLALNEAARLAGVSHETLTALNPGVLNGSHNPANTPVLLVPSDNAERLVARLTRSTPSLATAGGWQQYVVRRGDNLSAIASRFATSVSQLRRRNGLDDDTLQVGQTLHVPAQQLAANRS
ncbi:transglycosylase SLT domain-containing protein [Bisbaumannia pacifica]|uniref:Transglycosylase SLT domain-containing protein n=1 Tax=Bisbaumannia pacifica TaxID=77098 RepID=A0ABD4KW97_9GAMM|nr:transglycosylase SLT domain-containing protein [Halomonas pacifica]MBH8578725.1 transglycosylase SLT domain-containing protein [Halomonas pacifica]